MDGPWYGSDVPYYAENDPGNVALGENNEIMYYRSMEERPLEYLGKGKMAMHKVHPHAKEGMANHRTIGRPLMPKGKAANKQRLMSTVEAFATLVPKKKGHHMEYLDIKAVKRLLVNARKESLVLLNAGAHAARLESMKCDIGGEEAWCNVCNFDKIMELVRNSDIRNGMMPDCRDDYDPFNSVMMDEYGDMEGFTNNRHAQAAKMKQRRKIPVIMIDKKPKEFLMSNFTMNMDQLHSIFSPRNENLAKSAARSRVPATAHNAKKLFKTRAECMAHPGISSDKYVPVAMSLFSPYSGVNFGPNMERYVVEPDMRIAYSVFQPGSGRNDERLLSAYTPKRGSAPRG